MTRFAFTAALALALSFAAAAVADRAVASPPDDAEGQAAPEGSAAEIPFFHQKGNGCVQAQMRMLLGRFLPERIYEAEDLDHRTGRGTGQWTWFPQALPVLVEEGLDARLFSSLDYTALHPERLERFYDAETAEIYRRMTNWESLMASMEFLTRSGRFERRKLSGDDLEAAWARGDAVAVVVDAAVLEGRGEEPYQGHAVTITHYGAEVVRYHDSAAGPDREVSRESFEAAWNAAGTDNDTIVVRGLIEPSEPAEPPGD